MAPDASPQYGRVTLQGGLRLTTVQVSIAVLQQMMSTRVILSRRERLSYRTFGEYMPSRLDGCIVSLPH